MDSRSDTQDVRLLLKPPEAARALGIGTRKLWSLTNCGQIRSVRIGRRVLYPVEVLRKFVAKLETET